MNAAQRDSGRVLWLAVALAFASLALSLTAPAYPLQRGGAGKL